MIDKEAIMNATVGNFDFSKFTHPLFRTGSEQEAVWGRFSLRSANQKSDPNYYNTLNMEINKKPAATSLGALGDSKCRKV